MNKEEKIELKYCERCGGLWLRREGFTGIYCVTCAPQMQQMAIPRKKSATSGTWKRRSQDLGGVACA